MKFCEVTLQAVISEYGENNEETDKNCLLEMLELSLSYLDLVEEQLGTDLHSMFCQIVVQIQQSKEQQILKRGRPKVLIDKERLIFLKDCGFSVTYIAMFFGCSRRTIERRISEYSIPRRCDVYSSTSDSELDEKVLNIVSLFPGCGQKSVDGRLKSEGIKFIL